jgi:hypothetical protein
VKCRTIPFAHSVALVIFTRMVVRGLPLALLVWTCVLCATLLTPTSAHAQSSSLTAQVVQLGFDNYFRPGQWVPVKVRINSPTAQYELRITQRDADGDRVLFTRDVVVTGDSAGGARQQDFWAYFLPEGIDGGLPQNDSQDLAERLRITLHSTDGTELIAVSMSRQLPRSLDPPLGGSSDVKGNRLILLVNGIGANTKLFSEPARVLGTLEHYNFLPIRSDQLPQSAVGFEMVDAVVWCTSLPGEVAQDPARIAAMKEWVRKGGHLVIATPAQWQQLEAFGDLMPVTLGGVDPQPTVPALTRVNNSNSFIPRDSPVRVARATPKPGAFVDLTTNPEAEPANIPDQPLIVRTPYGTGCVTWLAIDVLDPALTREASAWLTLWPRFLAFGDTPRFAPEPPPGQARPPWINQYTNFGNANSRDMGASVLGALSQSGTAAALVGIAALFFIAYWIIAGPALYFFLMRRKQQTWNWLGYAATATLATFLTLGVVRLVLSGPPSITHHTIVRGQAPASNVAPMPLSMWSRFGLYVRQNTELPLSLDAADSTVGSYLVPYAQHAILRSSDEVTVAAPRDYGLSMPTEPTVRLDSLNPYFRTTLKRFFAHYVGTGSNVDAPPPAIIGTPVLAGPRVGEVDGTLQNLTGQNLRNVYLVFTMPVGNNQVDQLYYLPRWNNGDTLDFRKTFTPPEDVAQRRVAVNNRPANNDRPLYGNYTPVFASDPDTGWPAVWFGGDIRVTGISFSNLYDDFNQSTPTSVPVLSLFSRLPTMMNRGSGANTENNRVELRRSGVRDFDISSAVAAGNMVIVAQADNATLPMPTPVKVNGRVADSRGKIIYQFVLPLQRKWPQAQER